MPNKNSAASSSLLGALPLDLDTNSEKHIENEPSSFRATQSASSSFTLSHWLSLLQPILQKYLDQHQDPDIPVVQHLSPQALFELLQLSHQSCNVERIIQLIQLTLDYSVRTGHPMFLDKLYSGVSTMGVISELITAILNANTHVYHVSPVATLMEYICTQRLLHLISYPLHQSTGIMCPGGAMSNLVAMCTARNHMFPHVKEEGMAGIPHLVVLTSEQAHFSIHKAAMILGIGHSYIFTVTCNDWGQMIPSDLENKIELAKSKGWIPFFIAATSGTTVLSAFDPLDEIASIAKKYGCWLHVDGSYGGAFIFVPSLKEKFLHGLELSDSFVLNPHKLLGVPLQCSCLLVKLDSNSMIQANQSGVTDYLYHHDGLDLGEQGIGCGRRADSIKLYFCWQAEGSQGFGKRVQAVMDLRRQVDQWLPHQPGIQVLPTMGPNVCFWYVPNIEEGEQKIQVLDAFTIALRTKVLESGLCMIDHASVPLQPSFFRIPLHPDTQLRHIQEVIQHVSLLGAQLWDTSNQGFDPLN